MSKGITPLKIRFEEFEREVRGRLQPRDADAFAGQIFFFHVVCGDDDGAVAFAEAGAAIEENVFIAERRVSREADGGDIVGFGERGFVQGLNV